MGFNETMYKDFNKECINKFGNYIILDANQRLKNMMSEIDDTIFSGFAPNIIFERSGTLANGNEKCDFHFKNGKYIKEI